MKRFAVLILSIVLLVGVILPYVSLEAEAASPIGETSEYKQMFVDVPMKIEITKEGQTAYYKFIPGQSGTYRIFSNSNGFDTDCSVYNSNFEEIAYGDWNDRDWYDFDMEVELTAGETYYIESNYSDDTIGTFYVTIKLLVKATSMEILNGDRITCYLDKAQWLIPGFYPLGESLEEECTWTSSDKSVAMVESYASGGKVTGVGIGTTKISVVSESGYQDSIEVTVCEVPEIEEKEQKYITTAQYGEDLYYKFTPRVDGWYQFYSEGNVNSITALIESSDGGACAWREGFAYYQCFAHDFKINCNMEAGQTYYLNVESEKALESPFSISIVQLTKEAESVAILADDVVVGNVGERIGIDVVFSPDVCIPEYFSFQSEDTAIVNIWSIHNVDLYKVFWCLDLLSPGTTTVTVKTENGLSDSIEVRVVEPNKVTVNADAITKEQTTLEQNIEGEGTYTEGDSVTVLAEEKLGYEFLGWYEFSEDGNSYVGDALSEELSYTFVVETDRNLVAVYEMVGTTTLKVNGAQFKVNDSTTQMIYNYTQDFNVGTEIKLTATGENFAYWMNESNKIVSTEREYTFTLSQPTIVTVVYKNAVAGETAFVEFVSDYDQVLQAQNYSSASKILLPNGPSKSGYVFKNWSMTGAEIKAAIAEGETYIRVTPVYEKIVEYFDVTVVYDGNTEGAQAYQDVLGYEFLQLSAKAIEGRKFAYWSDALTNGNVLSTSDTYSLYVNKDITVYAIYVDDEEEVEINPIITMTNAYTSVDAAGTKKVHFEATRNIPEGYTLQEHGVLYSTNSAYGGEDAEDTMKIGGSNVNKNIATTTGNEGIYVLNVSIGTKVDITIFARGYMILTNNATGENETFYSQIMSGSYSSLL